MRQPKDVARNWQANQQAFTLYVMAEGGAGDMGRTVSLYEQREKLDLFGRAYLALAFALLDDEARVEALLSDITGGRHCQCYRGRIGRKVGPTITA